MEQFDIIVIGSGSGMLVASAAVDQGFRVALVEMGKMGGTCINVGCVPSKMLIYPTDVIATIKEAGKLGVNATINSVDFNNIMTRMRALVNEDSGHQAIAVEATPNYGLVQREGRIHLRLHDASWSTHHHGPYYIHRFRRTSRDSSNQGHRQN